MRCDRCGRDAVLSQRYSGLRLCGEHFLSALEARAKQTIRTRGWILPGDRIAVGLSGGPASCSLLHFLATHFGMRRDLSLVAITVDEGNGMDTGGIRAMAGRRGIEWIGTGPGGGSGEGNGAAVSGRWGLRDIVLESLAREGGATKLAMGTSLDTRAGSVFLHVLRGDGAGLFQGTGQWHGGIPRIEPFIRIPADEISLYARLNGLDPAPSRAGEAGGSLENEAGRILKEFTARHPSALFSISNLGDALLAGGPGIRPPDPSRGGRSGGRAPPPGGARSTGQGGRTHG